MDYWQQVEDSEREDRWLVSYADFITLLFAFFVVMYSTTQAQDGYLNRAANSLASAFYSFPDVAVVHKNRALTPRNSIEQVWVHDMKNLLLPWIESGKARVEQRQNAVLIELSGEQMFASGSAEMTPETVALVKSLAPSLIHSHGFIRVEGHTDAHPIHNALYPSNWELSAARAARVVRELQEEGVAPTMMMAAGFGPYRPLAGTKQWESEDTRHRNRRVSLWVEVPNGFCRNSLRCGESKFSGEMMPTKPTQP